MSDNLDKEIDIDNSEKGNSEKKDKKMFDMYAELIKDTLFEESFIALERNVSKIEDVIEKNQHIRKFFLQNCSQEVLNDLLDKNVVYPFAESLTRALFEKPFLKETIKKFSHYVDSNVIAFYCVTLILNQNFDLAKNLLTYIDKDITIYKQTLNQIIETKNKEALEFVCKNMNNIHFNQGALLKICAGMPEDSIRMLIEKFGFDINEQSNDDGSTFVHSVINDKNLNLKNFKFLVDNYGNNIDWSLKFKLYKKDVTAFDQIESSSNPQGFYNVMLNDLTLKSHYVQKIANFLLTEKNTDNTSTELYQKLFSHPNFNPNEVTLGQKHFLYGVLSYLGQSAKRAEGNKDESNQYRKSTKNYLRILNTYLHSYVSDVSDTVPESSNLNIVGAVVQVCVSTKNKNDGSYDQDCLSAAELICRQYKQYINKVNPSGELPISVIVEESHDSELYRILVKNGAIEPETASGFWGAFMKMLPGTKRRDTERLEQAQKEAIKEKESLTNSNGTNFGLLKAQMRESLKEIRVYIQNPLCDPIIKFQCENMFLRSEKLINLMENYNINQSFDDLTYLKQNFSQYLKSTLETYIKACETTVDFGKDNQDMLNTLDKLKSGCINQMTVLGEQLELISQNIAAEAQGQSLTNFNIRGKFLATRFQTAQSMGIDKIINKGIQDARELKGENDNGMTVSKNINDVNFESKVKREDLTVKLEEDDSLIKPVVKKLQTEKTSNSSTIDILSGINESQEMEVNGENSTPRKNKI